MLHGCRIEFGANALEPGLALDAVVVGDAHFDQFMGKQADVDFMQDGGGEAGMPDDDHRMQSMSLGTQIAALGGC